VRSGDLRHRVEIQAATTDTSTIDHAPTWAPVATVWASIVAKSGTEAEKGEQVKATTDYEITIRHYDGLTSAHRIVKGTTVYNILSVVPDERGVWQVCTCRVKDG